MSYALAELTNNFGSCNRQLRREAVFLFPGRSTRECPLLAQSVHQTTNHQCPLLGVKRTSFGQAAMSANDRPQVALRPIREETAMNVLDDYLVDPRLSLLDKTRT